MQRYHDEHLRRSRTQAARQAGLHSLAVDVIMALYEVSSTQNCSQTQNDGPTNDSIPHQTVVSTQWFVFEWSFLLPSNSRRREMRGKVRHPQLAATMVAFLLLLVAFAPTPANSASTSALITAVYYDTYLTDEPDEAFRLMNVSEAAVDLTDWTVTDLEGTITLSDTLAAGASIWIAREADDFTLEFGFLPDYEYGADTDQAVPDLITSGTFALANTGDEIVLKDAGAVIVDSVVYEGGDPTGTGWSSPGVYPYGGDTVGIERFAQEEQGIEAFGKEGQVLYRKLNQATGLPIPDTDTAADWAQATAVEDNGLDSIIGKKVQYPGWDLEEVVLLHSACPCSLVQKVSEGKQLCTHLRVSRRCSLYQLLDFGRIESECIHVPNHMAEAAVFIQDPA
jgi:hypothetical protein